MRFRSQEEQTGYTRNEGAVRYLDDSPLKRPAFIPRKLYAIVGVIALVAAGAGFFVASNITDNIVNAPQRAKEQTAANLARDVSLDLPVLSSLMASDDATILQGFADAGLTTISLSADEEGEDANNGFDIAKLPADVNEAEAAAMYLKGIKKLSAADASKLLKGSWTMTVSRDDGTEMRVKYADFDSGTVEAAVQKALVTEGLDSSELGESGIDEAGNTYQEGTVSVDGSTYYWRISAIQLSSVYDISGLPKTAVYVGIRMKG